MPENNVQQSLSIQEAQAIHEFHQSNGKLVLPPTIRHGKYVYKLVGIDIEGNQREYSNTIHVSPQRIENYQYVLAETTKEEAKPVAEEREEAEEVEGKEVSEAGHVRVERDKETGEVKVYFGDEEFSAEDVFVAERLSQAFSGKEILSDIGVSEAKEFAAKQKTIARLFGSLNTALKRDSYVFMKVARRMGIKGIKVDTLKDFYEELTKTDASGEYEYYFLVKDAYKELGFDEARAKKYAQDFFESVKSSLSNPFLSLSVELRDSIDALNVIRTGGATSALAALKAIEKLGPDKFKKLEEHLKAEKEQLKEALKKEGVVKQIYDDKKVSDEKDIRLKESIETLLFNALSNEGEVHPYNLDTYLKNAPFAAFDLNPKSPLGVKLNKTKLTSTVLPVNLILSAKLRGDYRNVEKIQSNVEGAISDILPTKKLHEKLIRDMEESLDFSVNSTENIFRSMLGKLITRFHRFVKEPTRGNAADLVNAIKLSGLISKIFESGRAIDEIQDDEFYKELDGEYNGLLSEAFESAKNIIEAVESGDRSAVIDALTSFVDEVGSLVQLNFSENIDSVKFGESEVKEQTIEEKPEETKEEIKEEQKKEEPAPEEGVIEEKEKELDVDEVIDALEEAESEPEALEVDVEVKDDEVLIKIGDESISFTISPDNNDMYRLKVGDKEYLLGEDELSELQTISLELMEGPEQETIDNLKEIVEKVTSKDYQTNMRAVAELNKKAEEVSKEVGITNDEMLDELKVRDYVEKQKQEEGETELKEPEDVDELFDELFGEGETSEEENAVEDILEGTEETVEEHGQEENKESQEEQEKHSEQKDEEKLVKEEQNEGIEFVKNLVKKNKIEPELVKKNLTEEDKQILSAAYTDSLDENVVSALVKGIIAGKQVGSIDKAKELLKDNKYRNLTFVFPDYKNGKAVAVWRGASGKIFETELGGGIKPWSEILYTSATPSSSIPKNSKEIFETLTSDENFKKQLDFGEFMKGLKKAEEALDKTTLDEIEITGKPVFTTNIWDTVRRRINPNLPEFNPQYFTLGGKFYTPNEMVKEIKENLIKGTPEYLHNYLKELVFPNVEKEIIRAFNGFSENFRRNIEKKFKDEITKEIERIFGEYIEKKRPRKSKYEADIKRVLSNAFREVPESLHQWVYYDIARLISNATQTPFNDFTEGENTVTEDSLVRGLMNLFEKRKYGEKESEKEVSKKSNKKSKSTKAKTTKTKTKKAKSKEAREPSMVEEQKTEGQKTKKLKASESKPKETKEVETKQEEKVKKQKTESSKGKTLEDVLNTASVKNFAAEIENYLASLPKIPDNIKETIKDWFKKNPDMAEEILMVSPENEKEFNDEVSGFVDVILDAVKEKKSKGKGTKKRGRKAKGQAQKTPLKTKLTSATKEQISEVAKRLDAELLPQTFKNALEAVGLSVDDLKKGDFDKKKIPDILKVFNDYGGNSIGNIRDAIEEVFNLEQEKESGES